MELFLLVLDVDSQKCVFVVASQKSVFVFSVSFSATPSYVDVSNKPIVFVCTKNIGAP